jgi:hypothetical protein
MANCDRCGIDLTTYQTPCTTGYAIDGNGKRICFACCGVLDEDQMIACGRALLYLTLGHGQERLKLTNWPSSLVFGVADMRTGRHNLTGKRYDVWFHGPDGYMWHGVQFGDNTQICHCRRTRQASYI